VVEYSRVVGDDGDVDLAVVLDFVSGAVVGARSVKVTAVPASPTTMEQIFTADKDSIDCESIAINKWPTQITPARAAAPIGTRLITLCGASS